MTKSTTGTSTGSIPRACKEHPRYDSGAKARDALEPHSSQPLTAEEMSIGSQSIVGFDFNAGERCWAKLRCPIGHVELRQHFLGGNNGFW